MVIMVVIVFIAWARRAAHASLRRPGGRPARAPGGGAGRRAGGLAVLCANWEKKPKRHTYRRETRGAIQASCVHSDAFGCVVCVRVFLLLIFFDFEIYPSVRDIYSSFPHANTNTENRLDWIYLAGGG
jgi:hypothetical protein